MIKAIEVIYQELSKYGTFYYENAPTKELPYSTFNMNVPATTFKTQIVELVIDLWDNEVGRLEQLRESVFKNMDGFTYADSEVALSVRQLMNMTIADPDVSILRRQLTFQVLMEV